MELGVVTSFDKHSQRGAIAAPDGREFHFSYMDGQNMVSGAGSVVPQFTGRHEQPEGYQLKVPRPGDPVAFTISTKGIVDTWGYARHFLDLAERQHGSDFAS